MQLKTQKGNWEKKTKLNVQAESERTHSHMCDCVSAKTV